MIVAHKDSLSDVAFLTAVLMDEHVRSGSVIGVDKPKIPTVDELLSNCYVLLFKDGFIAFQRFPGPYAVEAHLCFLPNTAKGRYESVLSCCKQALFWLFTQTPVERVLASAFADRKELHAIGKGLGFRTFSQTDTHTVFSLDVDDWVVGCEELESLLDSISAWSAAPVSRAVRRFAGLIFECGRSGFGQKGVKCYNRNVFCLDRDALPAVAKSSNPLTIQIGEAMLVVEDQGPEKGGE